MRTNSPSETAALSPATRAAAWAAFVVAATLNAGGYRYGTSDQAFYIPAILHQLDPSLFPRDWAMLGAQGRFFFVDELFAALVSSTGLALPVWFAVAQLATLTLLFAGAYALGRQWLTSRWALVAWLAALTLRHRIAKTGANTLEGYFHPRMLVFAIGLVALADLLRGRRVRPVALLVASAALHPTTAALFLGIVVIALIVAAPHPRRAFVVACFVVSGVAAAAAVSGVAGPHLVPMDPAWRALVASKDYTFPSTWSLATWVTNLAGALVIGGVGWRRHRDGQLPVAARGVLIGCLLLVAAFVVTLPLVAAGVPIAVQLQTSRVFWPVETIAMLCLVWALVDRPAIGDSRAWVPRAVAILLVAVSVSRAVYVGLVESPDRATVAFDLPNNDWTAALRWVREHTPHDAAVLADPGHAWRQGTAVRIGASRDVFLEDTKDVAMAMYSRDAAHRVLARIGATQGFAEWTADQLRTLAAQEHLDLFVTERTLDLPVAHRAGAITVYHLPR